MIRDFSERLLFVMASEIDLLPFSTYKGITYNTNVTSPINKDVKKLPLCSVEAAKALDVQTEVISEDKAVSNIADIAQLPEQNLPLPNALQIEQYIDFSKLTDTQKIQILENRIKLMDDYFSNIKSHQGFIGKSWNWLKNKTGIGAGSNKAQKAIDELKEKIKLLKEHPEKLSEIFKEITGKDLTFENLEKYTKNELKLKGQDKLLNYIEGQEMAKGLVSTLTTIGAVTGLMAVGIIGTPFTGGASLIACLGASAAVGAGASTILNGLDTLTSEAKDFGHLWKDSISGGVDGMLTVLTAGVGNIIAKYGEMLFYKPFVINGVRGTVAGAMFGSGGSTTHYLLDAENKSVSGFAKATSLGALTGGVFGLSAGAVGSAFGKVAEKTAIPLNKLLTKTVTSGITLTGTGVSGFVGGGLSSELEYLITSDNRNTNDALDAFLAGGQGGSLMTLGFHFVDKGIMKTVNETSDKKIEPAKTQKTLTTDEKMKLLTEKVKLSEEDLANSNLRANVDLALAIVEEYKGLPLEVLLERKCNISPELFKCIKNAYHESLLDRFFLQEYPMTVIETAFRIENSLPHIESKFVDKTYTTEEKTAIHDIIDWYQATTGNSGEVNNALREGKPLTDNAQKIVECFDRVKRPFGKNAGLVRATNDFQVSLENGTKTEYSKLKPGDEFTDRGYVSTMEKTGLAIIESFAADYKHFIVIKTPATQEVIVPADFETNGFDSMQERILPRGTKFRVVSNDSLKDYGTIFTSPIEDRRLIVLEIVE